MAKALHFFGEEEIKKGITTMDREEFTRVFGKVKAVRPDYYTVLVGRNAAGELCPINRVIYRKPNPSNHKCGSKCRNAKGHDCECSCGGRYHGIGA